MQRIFLFLISLLLTLNCFGQKREIIYKDSKDTITNYYITYFPKESAKGLLILLPSFMETPEQASNETDIYKVATDKGLITVFVSLQYGYNTFYIDSLSQFTLDTLITKLQKRYLITDKPFYLGGFSLGGSGVVKYAERAYSSNNIVRPKAIFAIDPPLDFERFYISSEQEIRFSKSETTTSEAAYFIKRLQYEFDNSPQINKLPYHIISPYSYSDTMQINIRKLISCPIRLISEPDILWQMTNRNRSLYDLNIIDCSSAINSLTVLGNKNAGLIITTNKGYRKFSGKRNPHSWSIADSNETVNWLLEFQ
jgi:hypothetical protein